MGGTKGYNVDVKFQEGPLGIRQDEESKIKPDSGAYMLIWQNEWMPNKYPSMWKVIFKLLIIFPTSYLVQAGLSAVNHILIKKRNALDISERRDMMLTNNELNILDLISKH